MQKRQNRLNKRQIWNGYSVALPLSELKLCVHVDLLWESTWREVDDTYHILIKIVYFDSDGFNEIAFWSFLVFLQSVLIHLPLFCWSISLQLMLFSDLGCLFWRHCTPWRDPKPSFAALPYNRYIHSWGFAVYHRDGMKPKNREIFHFVPSINETTFCKDYMNYMVCRSTYMYVYIHQREKRTNLKSYYIL